MKALEKDRRAALRDGQRLRGRRAALPGRRAGGGVPAVGVVPASQVRPPEPARRWRRRGAGRAWPWSRRGLAAVRRRGGREAAATAEARSQAGSGRRPPRPGRASAAPRRLALARRAVDEMYTQVAENWLATQGDADAAPARVPGEGAGLLRGVRRRAGRRPGGPARGGRARGQRRRDPVQARAATRRPRRRSAGRSERFEALAGEFPASPPLATAWAGAAGLAASSSQLGRAARRRRHCGGPSRSRSAGRRAPEEVEPRRDLIGSLDRLGACAGRRSGTTRRSGPSGRPGAPGHPDGRRPRRALEPEGSRPGLEMIMGLTSSPTPTGGRRRSRPSERSVGLYEGLLAEGTRRSRLPVGLAVTMNNLGALMGTLGRHADQEACYRRSSNSRRPGGRVPRPARHRESLVLTQLNLSGLLKEKGRRSEAEQLTRRALEIS